MNLEEKKYLTYLSIFITAATVLVLLVGVYVGRKTVFDDIVITNQEVKP